MADPNTVAAAIQAVINLFGGSGDDNGPTKIEFLSGMTVLNTQIENTFQHLRSNTDRNLNSIIQTGENVHAAVAGNIHDQTNVLVPIIQGGISTILNAINQGQGGSSDQESQAVNTILNAILGSRNTILNGQDQIVSSILSPTISGINTVNNNVFGLTQDIDSGFTGVFSVLGEVLAGINDQGQQVINNQIIIDDSIYGSVIRDVGGIIDTVLAQQQGVIDGVSGSFSNIIGDLLGVIALEQIGEQDHLKRIADVMGILQDPTLENISRMGDKGLDGFGGSFSEGTLGALGNYFAQHAGSFRSQMNQTLYGHSHPRDNDSCGLADWDDTWVDNDVPNWLAEVLIWAVTALMLPLNASQVKANRAMQSYRQCFPDMLLQPGDLVGSWYKGLINDDKMLTDLEKQGFTHDDAEILANAAETYPTLDLVFSMWFRNEIEDSTLDNYLRGLGYGRFSREKLKNIAFFIPPVQDRITMAVREVFRPEVAQANGQFEDFPEDFAKWAKQQGVSDEWARNYWAAHWQLPSPQMGFEMFHRQEIDEERLRGLMTALDIMPGWRDEMIAISYNPLTRVDVRRMHALGVLNDEQVEKAYRDIGYSPDNAALMLEFTKQYNDDEDLLTLNVASDLTRSNIVDFYKDGIIDRTLALGLLLQAGINAIAAELFLDSADFDIERRERSSQVGLILDKYKHGVFTFAQANDAINALGLEERERALVGVELVKVQQALNKVPSRADLDKFINAGLIDGALYLETMERNGYSRDWAEKYLLLASGVEDGDSN